MLSNRVIKETYVSRADVASSSRTILGSFKKVRARGLDTIGVLHTDGDTLLLSSRQSQAAFSYNGVVALGEAQNPLMDLRHLGGVFHLPVRGQGIPVANVIANGVVEQHSVLGDHANCLAQAGLGDFRNVLPVDPNRP